MSSNAGGVGFGHFGAGRRIISTNFYFHRIVCASAYSPLGLQNLSNVYNVYEEDVLIKEN